MKAGWKGILLAVAVGIALIALGCSSGGNVLGVDEGRVQFVISTSNASVGASLDGLGAVAAASGSPVAGGSPLSRDEEGDDGHDRSDELKVVNVTFSSILARNLEGQLIDVDISLPVTVDMLSVLDGRSFSLPVGSLPSGTYDQIVVVITQVELITQDDVSVVITPPGGGWTAIVAVCPFTVVEGETTTVRLRFVLHESFSLLDGRVHFEPRFECDDE